MEVCTMKRILVVDDEQEVLYVFKRLLEQMQYEFTTCDNWEDALKAYSEKSYDLAILDVHMPGRDGFQIAKEMRMHNPKQKIMIVTGLSAGDAYQFLSSSDADVNEVLYKPFSVEKVKTMIGGLLEQETP